MRVESTFDLFSIISSQPFVNFVSSDRTCITAKLFDFCAGCKVVRMAAVPQGAFAAHKVRLNAQYAANWQRHLQQDQDAAEGEFEFVHSSASSPKVTESTMEQPMKYSSKLMNSIWGLYNRYSVHNFKKNTDGKQAFIGEHQLQAAVSHPALKRFFVACEKN